MNRNTTSNSSSGLDRRGFLITSAGTVAWLAMGGLSSTVQAAALPHVLPTLPYAENALEPTITARTIGFHYGKHHKTYVDNLNKIVMETEFADLPLEKIITGTAGRPECYAEPRLTCSQKKNWPIKSWVTALFSVPP